MDPKTTSKTSATVMDAAIDDHDEHEDEVHAGAADDHDHEVVEQVEISPEQVRLDAKEEQKRDRDSIEIEVAPQRRRSSLLREQSTEMKELQALLSPDDHFENQDYPEAAESQPTTSVVKTTVRKSGTSSKNLKSSKASQNDSVALNVQSNVFTGSVIADETTENVLQNVLAADVLDDDVLDDDVLDDDAAAQSGAADASIEFIVQSPSNKEPSVEID